MNRLSFLALAVPVLCAVLSPAPMQAQDDQVLMILKDSPSHDLGLALHGEVAVMQKMLQWAGFRVVIASPSGEPLTAGGITVTPDLPLADVRMEEYEGVILPCMCPEDDQPVPGLAAIVGAALASGKPVAAQTGSVVALAKSGILTGRKFAYPEDWVSDVPEFGSSVYAGDWVVEDGNLITSAVSPYAAQVLHQEEDGTQALTGAFIKHLW